MNSPLKARSKEASHLRVRPMPNRLRNRCNMSMRRKRHMKAECRVDSARRTADICAVTWDAFHSFLQDIGPEAVTVELVLKDSGCRFVAPNSYSSPSDGFDDLLYQKWLISYRASRCLVAFPACLRTEYFKRLKTELCCGGHGMSEGAFKIMFEDETRPLRLDNRRRWQIPSRLFKHLGMVEGERNLCLRPGYSWINIRPKTDDDHEYENALKESELVNKSLSHSFPGNNGDTPTLPYPKRGQS